MINNWQDVWKLPFSADSIGSYIWDAKMKMVAMFVVDMSRKDRDKVVSILNGTDESEAEEPITIDDGHIFLGPVPILLMRGWGYLTGTGGLGLDSDTAARLQDELAQYIVQRLTNKTLQ